MEKLGIELPLLITQIVNFTIMVVVLTKILYKPILRGLEARRKKIEEGLKLTEKMQHEEEKLKKKQEELLTEAREEARVILENAKKDGKRLKDELVEEGKRGLAQLKAKQEKELKHKYDDLTTELAKHTVEIAAAMVKRLLPEVMSEKSQHELVMKNLIRLEKQHEKASRS